jgi:hypothetical protein
VAQEEKGGKDSEYEFIPPDFDEDGFIHREMVSFRTTLILFLWGIVAAAVSWAAFAGLGGVKVGWLLGLGICAVFGYSLRYLFPKLGADIKHFGRREWLGTAALFFFTWLSFFIVAINPPVSDFAPPRVDLYVSPVTQEAGGQVDIHLFVEDNVRIDAHDFILSRGGTAMANTGDLVPGVEPGHYVYTTGPLPPGIYELRASATDGRGHRTDHAVTFAVQEGLVDYSATAGGVLAGAADRVLVRLDDALPTCRSSKGQVTSTTPCVRTVRLELVGGGQVNLRWIADECAWVATSAHAGWQAGQNTFDVVAELADRYDGIVRFDGGEVRDGPHTVDVTATPGNEAITPLLDPPPARRNVPGPAVPLLAVGLLALAVVLRRR